MRFRRPPPPEQPLQLEELEPRVLFSADFVPVNIEAGMPAAEIEVVSTPVAVTADTAAERSPDAQRTELLIIDSQVPDYDKLLEAFLAANPGQDFEIHLLDGATKGIDGLGEIITSYTQVDAVHIISHGADGSVVLGDSLIDQAALTASAGELGSWQDHLTESADILFYGCNLAATTQGEAFVSTFAELSGADVAASDDLTGSAALGGDWELEVTTGSIEALTLTAGEPDSWDAVLATQFTSTGEMQVNTSTGGAQETSAQTLGSKDAVAMDSAGNYVVVWSDSVTDGSGYGIFAQRFDATGTKQGAEFQINQTTTHNQYWASVAMAEDGRFVVSWTSVNQDGTPASVYARQFNADGSAFGNEFRANSTTSGSQTNADVAMVRSGANAGDFVIVWQGNGSGDSDGIYGQRYAADGSTVGGEFFVNNTTTGLQENPAVAINDNGEFSVVWEDAENILLEFFDSAGNSQNLQKQVNTGSSILFTVNNSIRPDVVLDNSGLSSVVWRSENSAADGVYLRQVDKTGNLQGFSATWVSATSNPDSTSPTIARDALGNFFVTYQKSSDGDQWGIYGRGYDASLSPLSDEFLINSTTSGVQQSPSVALLDIDNFVIVWSGNGNGDSDGVFARQYSFPYQITVNTTNDTADGDTSSLANLKLDPGADGVVSLREAITAANNGTNSRDTIQFDIAGAGPHTINLGSALPIITDTIVLDGSTEPDYSGSPVVEINGAAAGDVNGLALNDSADNSSIKGLALTGFNGATNGIALSLNGADNVTVQGNYIGIKPDGVTPDGNRLGIDVSNNADRNIIGGVTAGQGNLISANTDGLIIADTASTRNVVRGNAIYANSESNFALSNTDTVTANDADDSDSGPNNLQNYPLLSSATISGADLTVAGSVTTTANTTLTLDFYAASSNASASGYPQAERYLGSSNVTTGDNGDGSGTASLNQLLSGVNVTNGEYITVIATDSNGNSSEMALSIAASGGNTDPNAVIAALAAINEGDALTLDASASSDPDGDTLSYNWDLNNDGTYGDATGVNPTIDWATLKTFGIDDDASYTIGLQVDDGNGGVATATTTLMVNNVAPTLSVTGATQAWAGGNYTLNLSATDPGNDTITSWTINWGDGSIETIAGTASSAAHLYNNTGFTNNILVSATDEDGTHLHNDLFAGRYVQNAGIYRIQGSWGNAPVQFANEGTLDKAIQPIVGPDGYLYVSGEQSKNVLRYDASTGAFIDVFATLGGNAGGLAFGPDGNLYVSNYSGKTIEKFDGTSGTSLGSFIAGIGGNPYGLTFGPDGNLYVNLYNTAEVLKFDGSTGASLGAFVASHAGGLGTPEQMIFGPDGNLYIADVANNSVLQFNGSDGSYISDFIAATEPNLDKPNGVAFGPDGHLYVSDAQDGDILRYDGATGAFIDVYASGLNAPSLLGFNPDLQVVVQQPQRLAVSADDSGNYVVVEETFTGSDINLSAQRYDASGNTVGGPITINTTTAGDQFDPDVAMDANGNFVVVWSSPDGSGGNDIVYRLFDSSGNPLTGELTTNSTTAGDQQFAAVAFGGDGNFIITWSSQGQDDGGDPTGWGVYARRFDGGTGAAIDTGGSTSEFLVNTTTAGDQKFSDVSADDYGDFVIGWQSDGQDGDGWGVYTKAWRETGNLLHDEILRNTNTVGDQHSITVAMEGDGDYTLAWVSDGQDGDAGGIYADNVAWGGSGTNTAGEFQISTTTAGNQYNPEIASDDVGNFIVTWTSTGQDGDGASETNVYGQLYKMKNSGPVILGSEFLVNDSYSAGNQGHPAAAAVVNGNVIAAWSGKTSANAFGTDNKVLPNVLVNEVPTIKLANAATAYAEGDAPLAIDPALTVSDPDSANLTGAAIAFRDGFAAGEDQLNFTDQLGISGNYDPATGVLTLSGTATVANYQTALRSVTYSNSSDTPSTTQRIVEFTVNDGAASSSDTRKLNVSATNTAPIIDNLTPSITENSSGLTITATDPEGDAITGYSISGGADAALFTIDNASGVLTFLTAPDFEAPTDANTDNIYEVEITTTDAQSASLAQLVTISVTNTNEAPSATNLSAAETYLEDTPLNLTDIVVTDVDSDVTVTLTLSDTAAGALNTGTSGAVTSTFSAGIWTASGAVSDVNALLAGLTFTPAADYSSSFTIATSVTDAVNPVVSGNKLFTATPVGDTPMAASITTDEDTQSGPIVIDRNANDSAEVTHFRISGISNGSLYLIDGVTLVNDGDFITYAQGQAGLKFTPAQNSIVAGSFDVEASQDGSTVAAQSGKATSTITVDAINDAPVNTVPASIAVVEDVASALTGISIADVDAGGSAMLVTLSVPSGSLAATTGSGVTVGGTAYDLTLTGTVTDINNFIAASNVTYTTAANANGSVTLTVLTSDQGNTGSGGAKTDSDTVTLAITAVDDAPTATNLNAAETYVEDTPLNLTNIVVTDVDSTVTVTLTLSDTAAGSLNTGTSGAVASTFIGGVWTASGAVADVNALLAGLTFTPATDYNSGFSMAITVSDGFNPAVTGTKAFTGTPVNDAPSFTTLGNQTVANNSGAHTVAGFASAAAGDGADESSQTFSYAVSNNNAALFSVGPAIDANGQLTFTVANGQFGTATVTVSVSDSGGTANGGIDTSAAQTFDITIQANTAPTISAIANQTIDEDGSPPALAFSVSDAETVAGSLVVSASSGNTALIPNGNLVLTDSSSGNWTIQATPVANQAGSATITVAVSDGTLTTNETFVVTVNPVGDTPAVASISTDEDTQSGPIVIDRSASDGTEVTHFKISGISNGTLYLNDGVTLVNDGDFITVAQGQAGLKFTPALNSTAAGSFDVEASEDGATVAAQSGKATSTISVTPVNDAPQISLPPAQSVNEDQPLGISGISISDIDDNTAQLQLTAASGKITVTPVGSALITSGGNHSADLTLSGSIADINATLNSLHYQGNPNFNGTDTLTISMTDSEGLTTESALAITVTPVPDAPEIQIAEQTTDSGERVAVITIEKSTLDGDEQAITHFRIDTVAAGTLFLANDEPLQSGDFITAAQARAGLIFKGDTQVLGDNGTLVISPAISDVNGEPVVPEGAEPSSVSPPIFPPDELSLNLKSAETVETFNESSLSDNNQTDDSDENHIQLLRNAPAVVTITKEFEQQFAALAIDLKPVQEPAKPVEGYREVAGDFVSFEPAGKQPAKSPGYAFLVNNVIHTNELQKDTLYTLSYEQMFSGMDQVRDELLQLDSNQQFILGSTAVASAGLSAGYVLWLLRSGLLISSVMASLPAWTFADPLPVLTSRASEDEDDDESLEDIIEKSEKKRKRPPAAAVEPETGV
ncbi:MAG: DUF4347 domain-containing protein [Thiotrichales bacterium]